MPSEDEGYDAGLETAAGEIVSAVEAKDATALASALKSFVEMCKS
jgi:tRNA threonylcarbamoyladenosine modification (KEOPS) complex  Pcc1 subunit